MHKSDFMLGHYASELVFIKRTPWAVMKRKKKIVWHCKKQSLIRKKVTSVVFLQCSGYFKWLKCVVMVIFSFSDLIFLYVRMTGLGNNFFMSQILSVLVSLVIKILCIMHAFLYVGMWNMLHRTDSLQLWTQYFAHFGSSSLFKFYRDECVDLTFQSRVALLLNINIPGIYLFIYLLFTISQ